MNIKRFTAPTAREALAKARMAFGDGTLILSNRPVAGGVEVVATAEESLSALEQPAADAVAAPLAQPLPQPRASVQRAVQAAAARTSVQEDTEQMAMSTLSFQDYVRDRMLRRRQEARRDEGDFATRTGLEPQPAPAPRAAAKPRPTASSAISRAFADEAAAEPRAATPARAAAPQPQRAAQRPQPEPAVLAQAPAAGNPGIVAELQSMKELIEDRFNTLTWLGQAKQDPIQSNLMLKLIRAGYSPMLSRALLERMPDELGAADAVRWLMGTLERNVKTDAGLLPLHQEGGIFALVGATGVGKTTTAAKLAAQCVRAYGANSVGLITLDTYRIAAHEQLRAYGRMLGVVAHLAHDRAALHDMLNLLGGKKMVIIDTTGVAPRDPRCRDMLDVLELPRVQRVTVLNAGSHGDTLDEVLGAYKPAGSGGQAILTKVDEAAKLGPALDAVVRHQLTLRGVTNGQRVPEDWESADAEKLVRQSMRAPAKSAFDPKAADLSFFFSQPSSAAEYAAPGARHA